MSGYNWQTRFETIDSGGTDHVQAFIETGYAAGVTLSRVNVSWQVVDYSAPSFTEFQSPIPMIFGLAWADVSGGIPDVPHLPIEDRLTADWLWYEAVAPWALYTFDLGDGENQVRYAGRENLNSEAQRRSTVDGPSVCLTWQCGFPELEPQNRFFRVSYVARALFLTH